MKLKLPVLLLLLGLSFQAFAQQEDNVTTDVTKITFLNPGFSYEKSIGRQSTLLAHLFVSASTTYTLSAESRINSHFYIDPALLLQYRYYYNYKRRQHKEKRTEMNSMNYISPTVHTIYSKSPMFFDHPEEEARRAVTTVGAVWGLQRNGEKRFSFDLNIGLGYMFGVTTVHGSTFSYKTNEGQLTFLGELNLGFWLNKRK